jgi:DNA-binding PadR family transcriptional regulator
MSDNSLPLAPATFLVLFALASGDRHGYGIMQDVRKLDASFQLGPATLYTTIQRLLDSGLIAEVSGPESGERRRRYYRITDEGSSALNLEIRRMESLVRKSKALRLRKAEANS